MYNILNVSIKSNTRFIDAHFVDFVYPLPQKAVFAEIQQGVKCIQPVNYTPLCYSCTYVPTLSPQAGQ